MIDTKVEYVNEREDRGTKRKKWRDSESWRRGVKKGSKKC